MRIKSEMFFSVKNGEKIETTTYGLAFLIKCKSPYTSPSVLFYKLFKIMMRMHLARSLNKNGACSYLH